VLIIRELLTRNANMRLQEFSGRRWLQVSGQHDDECLAVTISQAIGKLPTSSDLTVLTTAQRHYCGKDGDGLPQRGGRASVFVL
jgi:hypothetical protein